MLKYIIVYFIISAIVYLTMSFLVNTNKGIDFEFDELMDNGSVRMLALLIVSILWPITVPIIIINNIISEGEY